ncbi:hypothetical protein N7G274_002592 [Stereocaulon virgatum]|uniref:Uncharacterized protein n=1 Tax=Stereocaulon virgatum TaxID=373712 RepID=A0ABR4AG88_9LECA
MDVGAGAFFQKTFHRFLGLPRIVSGLLRRSRVPLRSSLEDGLGEGPFNKDHREYSEERRQSNSPQPAPNRTRTVSSTQANRIEAVKEPGQVFSEDDDIPYADGPGRILLHEDGPKDCLSMLLTEDMVSRIRSAGKERRALEQVERLEQDADLELKDAEVQVGTFHLVLEEARDEEETRRFELEQKGYEKRLGRARRRWEAISKELDCLKLSEKRSRSQLQDMLEHILEHAGLVDLMSLEPQEIEEETLSECGSSDSVKSESTAPSCGELLRRTIHEDFTNAKWAYIEAEKRFDDRQYYYEDQLQQYKEYAEGRQASVTRTMFDGDLFVEINQLTRNLIEAEDQLNAARVHAKALGLPDQWEQMLNGIIDPGTDGYRESEEAAVIAAIDRDRIEKWSQDVSESQDFPDFDACKDKDIDEWDAESVGASDSCSVVDYMGYRPKIAEWQDSCRLLRDERTEGTQAAV